MTEDIRHGVGKGISQERAKQAIDLLLEDKSDEFKAVVFEMCRQMDWPDDDPSFFVRHCDESTGGVGQAVS